MVQDKKIIEDAEAKSCSIITGVPLKDVKRLKLKCSSILESLKPVLIKLNNCCKDESKEYNKMLITFFFDNCFSILTEVGKLQVMESIITRHLNSNGDNKLIHLFEKIKKDEIMGEDKNGRRNSIRTRK